MSVSKMHRVPIRSLLAVAVVASLPLLAQAQQAAAETGPSSPITAEGAKTLDAVTVTATRREEPLQKVPVAVSVIDGDRAAAANLNNLRDISSQVPSLNFRSAASSKDQSLFLRGMGTVSTSPGVEPTVSTVVDGVPLSRQGQANLDLLDVDHIEILRGPQGTLFGKNASAGVVHILTKSPTEELSGYVDLSYFGEGDEVRAKAGISGALVPGAINARVTVLGANYGGNVTNVYNGDQINGYTRRGIGAKFDFVASENLRATVGIDYMRSHDTTPQGVVTKTSVRAYPSNAITNYPLFATALLPVVASEDNRRINSNYETYADDTNYGIAAQFDWEAGQDYQWTSITAYRKWNNTQFQDQDRLPGPTAAIPQQHDRGDLSFNQVSQELRVASPKGGFVDYVAGLFFMRGDDDEIYRRETTQVVVGAPRVNNGVAHYGTTNTNYSLFGEMTLNFLPRFRGIAGARLIRDDLSYNFVRTSTSPTPVPGIQTSFSSRGSTQEDGYSSRLGLQYDLSDLITSYFTFSRGYKGPAYNLSFSMLPQDTSVLKPETSHAYELGLKSSLLERRLEMNVALFHDTFRNYQVNFFDVYNGSPVTRLINAGSVSTRGVELDIAARPVENIRLTGALAYTKARIDRFNCPVGTSASCNVNGKPLPFAPDWKANIGAEYRIPVSETLDLTLSTDYSWQSEVQYSINQTPDTIQPAYGLWNATVALSNYDGWKIALFAKNLTGQHYAATLGTFANGVVRSVPRGDQRYFGINLHKDF